VDSAVQVFQLQWSTEASITYSGSFTTVDVNLNPTAVHIPEMARSIHRLLKNKYLLILLVTLRGTWKE
jgi:hypothetical protein